MMIRFCKLCGSDINYKIPEGDSIKRAVCLNCNSIDYENPKIIAGILPVYRNEILLCQRAIDPKKNKWTIPAGFLELGETLEEGALREAKEEACISPNITQLYCIFNLPHIGQVYMLYLATLTQRKASPGIETESVDFFSFDSIPWNDIAFSSVDFILRNYISDYPSKKFPLRSENTINKVINE